MGGAKKRILFTEQIESRGKIKVPNQVPTGSELNLTHQMVGRRRYINHKEETSRPEEQGITGY